MAQAVMTVKQKIVIRKISVFGISILGFFSDFLIQSNSDTMAQTELPYRCRYNRVPLQE